VGSLTPRGSKEWFSIRTPEQVRWDFVTGWLAKAEEDLDAAKLILGGALRSWGPSSFHSQQAAEKALKALLVRHQIEFHRTHDIGELLQLAEPCTPGISGALAPAQALTPFAVETRYPGSEPVTKAEAARHVELADRVMTHVRQTLASYLTAGRPGA
jgi:HEPN domain-containing protein